VLAEAGDCSASTARRGFPVSVKVDRRIRASSRIGWSMCAGDDSTPFKLSVRPNRSPLIPLQMDISLLVPAAVRSTGVDLQAYDFTGSNALVGGKDDAE